MKEIESEQKAPKFKIIDSQANAAPGQDSGTLSGSPLLESSSSPTQAHAQSSVEYDNKLLARKKIIYPGMRDQEALNSFRSLRMKLQAKMEKPNSVILVSSVGKKGGSSFAAVNLAVAFTFEHGRNALIVDCNLGNSGITKQLELDVNVGLYNYLAGEEPDARRLVQPTMIPRLYAVSSGRPVDGEPGLVEVFGSERIETFINEVSNQQPDRVVILDAPPILESADTKMLADISNQIVVSVPYGGATPMQINKTVKEFGENEITGFVMVN